MLPGNSTTCFRTSRYCRAKVEFNSINLVRYGSSTTFKSGLRSAKLIQTLIFILVELNSKKEKDPLQLATHVAQTSQLGSQGFLSCLERTLNEVAKPPCCLRLESKRGTWRKNKMMRSFTFFCPTVLQRAYLNAIQPNRRD